MCVVWIAVTWLGAYDDAVTPNNKFSSLTYITLYTSTGTKFKILLEHRIRYHLQTSISKGDYKLKY